MVRGIRCAPAIVCGALALSMFGRPTLMAQSSSATLTVSANVKRNCTISTTPVSFGDYDPVVTNSASPLDGTGNVTITCTRGTPAKIGLGPGQNASGAARRMINGANFLGYELFRDTGRGQSWGLTDPAQIDAGAATSTAPRSFTVYGRVSAGQDVPIGAYADTVLAVVNF